MIPRTLVAAVALASAAASTSSAAIENTCDLITKAEMETAAPNAGAAPAPGAAPPARGTSPSTANTAPIDVCAIVTADDAKALFGPLPMQPPATTDNAGFGVRACMYIGPALSGEGAQTRFARLMVQAGRTKDAADLLPADADRRKATIDFAGGGDAAKRSADGMFVWETKGGLSCTAEIDVGLPPALTADTAAAKLADLCRKIFAAAAR